MRSSAWISAAMLTLGGCTTTYVGQKIGPDGTLTKPGGVPFVMTKPEYTVKIAADATDATKAVYTLTVNYVPDATQRYTLALDPALFVDGKLDLDFGASGNLTGAASTTTTHVVDTFGALVGLAIKVAPLLDAASTLETYKAMLSGDGCASLRTTIGELEAEAEREIGERANAKRARAEWVGERLHYLDQTQRTCMESVVKTIKTQQEDPAKQRYDKALAESEKAAKGNRELMLLNRQIKAEVAALNEEALSKIADSLTGKDATFASTQNAARQGAQYVGLRLAGRFARSLVDMTPEVWRARHLAYLERKIAQCRNESLVAGSKSACGERISTLQAEWFKTLGEPAIAERIWRIDKLLAQVHTSPADKQGRHSAVDEHVKLREERDKLQARIDQMRSDLIGKNKIVALGPDAPKPAKVEPRVDVPVTLVKREYVSAVNDKPADFKDGSLPEFVLVLEPDDTGAISPLPKPVGAKK